MIVQTSQMSPGHQPALGETTGRKLQESKAAADQMRHYLYLTDPSERRISIEDYVAAVLESSSSDLPA